MAQDWFAQNAPKDQDWFAANAPAPAAPTPAQTLQQQAEAMANRKSAPGYLEGQAKLFVQSEERKRKELPKEMALMGGGLLLSEVALPAAVGAIASRIPSAARASGAFETVLNAARKVPLDTNEMAQAAGKVETATRFGNLPPVIKKFILAHTNDEPITYEAGRNLIKNVNDAAQSLKMAGKENISRLVNEFGEAVKTANRGAAEKVGMGQLYDQAIKEYRQAKTIEEAAASLKKYGVKAAISALLGSAATAAGYGVYKVVR